MLAGLGATLWQADRARAQRDVAEAEARKSGAVVEFLTRVFSEAEPGQNDGKDPTASELLETVGPLTDPASHGGRNEIPMACSYLGAS